MPNMPSFEEFSNFARAEGYEPKTYSKICHYVFSKNGVKLELKEKFKSTNLKFKIAIAAESSAHVKVMLSEFLQEKGYDCSWNEKDLWVLGDYTNLSQFFEIVRLVEEFEVTQKKEKFSTKNIFQRMAKHFQHLIDEGFSQLLSRCNGLFDQIDDIIIVGESVNRTEENTYREHIVPCDFIVSKAVNMFKNGSSVTDVAIMIQQNLFIVLITNEEAYQLDVTMKLKTVMPHGWKFGDDVLARLTAANIILKK